MKPTEVFISNAALLQRNAMGLSRRQLIQMIVNQCGRAAPVIAFYDGREPWEADDSSNEGQQP